MLTRRAVLTGTAAASIAAIASAHGSASAAFNIGFGTLDDGAVAGFSKGPDSVGLFVKFQKAGAEVFFKKIAPGVVEVFQKTFSKGWSPMTSSFLKFLPTLDGAEGAFSKFDKAHAEFVLKGQDQIGVITTIELHSEGVEINVEEFSFDLGD